MWSALNFARLGVVASFVGLGVAETDEVYAQTDSVGTSTIEEAPFKPVDRRELRLKLLQSLLRNELQATSENQSKLVAEQNNLLRERAEILAAGDDRRSTDNVRLEQIEARLSTIDSELRAIDDKLKQVVAESDALQQRMDEARGIVPAKPITVNDGAAQQTGVTEDPASLWLDRKRRVQEALVYLGGYDALIDGDFGPRTAQAIRFYQESQSFEVTGVLTDEQQTSLLDQAAVHRSLYGVTTLEDRELGYRVTYPSFLLSNSETNNNERRLTTRDGTAELLISRLEESEDLDDLYADGAAIYEIQYRRKRNNWFVIAGLAEKDRVVYDTVRRVGQALIRARLSYAADRQDLWSPFAVIIFNTLGAIPTS